MVGFIVDYTSLPNLHPALVHFPIALLPVAILFDLVALCVRSQEGWSDRAAVVLYALSGLAAGAAYWAGSRAADSLVGLTPSQQLVVGEHRDAALISLVLIGVVAVVRIGVGLRDLGRADLWIRWLVIVAGLVSIVFVARAADKGGGLVFQHGIAVTPERAEPPRKASEDTPKRDRAPDVEPKVEDQSRPRILEDGSWFWEPKATDDRVLEVVLKPAGGASGEVVHWQPPIDQNQEGVALAVDGRTLLLLSEEYDDVQVEANLEVGDFTGTIGLAHHAVDATNAGLFTISTVSNEARLLVLENGTEGVMDSASVEVSTDLELAAFAAGGHFRGLMKGETVVHGHRSPLESGRCGLIVNGEGVIRILTMRIETVAH